MSGIVLSASVRQNLLSLQSTAALLATTQNDLATGNKVNSALDNPTDFFTAEGLNNRASDIGNLLDSIGNGVQVLQAANTGITSLQGLVSSAQSIANQVLQTPVGYSQKSNFTSVAINGANANNLLGSVGAATNASAAATSALTTITSTNSTTATAGTLTAGAFTAVDVSSAGTATHAIDTGTVDLTAGIADPGSNVTFSINSHTVTLTTGSGSGAGGNFTLSDIETAINGTASVGVHATDDGAGGHLILTSTGTAGAADSIVTSGLATAGLGIADATVHGAAAIPASETFSLTVDGGSAHNITLDAAHVSAFTTATGTLTGSVSALSAQDVANIINFQFNGNSLTGSTPATVAGGKLVFTSGTTGGSSSVATSAVTVAGAATGSTGITSATNTGSAAASGTALTFKVNNQTVTLAAGSSFTGAQVASAINGQVTGVSASYSSGKLVITSNGTPGSADAVTVGTFSAGDATALGFAGASVSVNGTAATGGLSGETLTIQGTGGGTATNITFGTAQGQISTLNELNTALAANNLQATIDSSTGQINIVTSNDAAASTIGAVGGTATATGSAFAAAAGGAPVADPNSQATRSSLVAQYNQVLQQINTTAQDSSFNGVNLLNGDTLKLVFNETGTSTLSITGVTFNGAGLGLSTLTSGSSFLDNSSANNVLSQLQNASTTLRSEASALGSNLSIVEIRQDFNKNLINVLQTGASNLTLADPNQEAADSQALSTRQSIAVSALALANQSQESVLQLLR